MSLNPETKKKIQELLDKVHEVQPYSKAAEREISHLTAEFVTICEICCNELGWDFETEYRPALNKIQTHWNKAKYKDCISVLGSNLGVLLTI